MTIQTDQLLWLDTVAQLAQRAVDQYDIFLSKPDDQWEGDQLFVAIRELRRVLDLTRSSRAASNG